MERQGQKNPVHLVPARRCFTEGSSRYLLFLIVLVCILSQVSVAQAEEPAWNYSSPEREIGGVAVSPKGDLVAVGAGNVLFFSKDGTLLDKEPFGNDVMMTADGKYTVSAYSSTLYFFKNSLLTGSPGSQRATKLGDYGLSEQVYSFDVSRDGSVIVGQTAGKSIFIINTITGVIDGNNKRADAIIKISPSGGIVGISQTALHFYRYSGLLSRTIILETNSAPHTLLLASDGNSAVFNDGQAIRRVNTNNGTERWKQQVTGYVSALSMIPSGSVIIAGTESGNLASLDANGTISWMYSANPENRQSAGITCVALSEKGTTIAAGTADGKILFLNSPGELTGSYNAHEYIRHIAASADGSLVVAASDDRSYAFSPSSLPVVTTSPARTSPAYSKKIPLNLTGKTPVTVPSRQATTGGTPTGLPTTYPVIRTATRSPPSFVTIISSLVLAFLLVAQKRRI